MKTISTFLVACFIFLSVSAHAFDALNFQFVSVFPSIGQGKIVTVNVYVFPLNYTYGWKEFNMNINGYNYPLNSWNTLQVGPYMAQATFLVPNWYPAWNYMQLWVNFYTQSYCGYPVPTAWESSPVQSLWF